MVTWGQLKVVYFILDLNFLFSSLFNNFKKKIFQNFIKNNIDHLFLLFIDSVYQYFYLENLLGFKYIDRNNFRITSFFGDDEVLGSYVSRLSPLLLFLFVYNNEKLSLIKKFYYSFFYYNFYYCSVE